MANTAQVNPNQVALQGLALQTKQGGVLSGAQSAECRQRVDAALRWEAEQLRKQADQLEKLATLVEANPEMEEAVYNLWLKSRNRSY